MNERSCHVIHCNFNYLFVFDGVQASQAPRRRFAKAVKSLDASSSAIMSSRDGLWPFLDSNLALQASRSCLTSSRRSVRVFFASTSSNVELSCAWQCMLRAKMVLVSSPSTPLSIATSSCAPSSGKSRDATRRPPGRSASLTRPRPSSESIGKANPTCTRSKPVPFSTSSTDFPDPSAKAFKNSKAFPVPSLEHLLAACSFACSTSEGTASVPTI
mmetsp:Transcript_10018/g.19658  ORF Transcript_10018/g.19658 Transcript_10018/m.19658 type:complete len:215 (+) Transcript_10018:45-689(+)